MKPTKMTVVLKGAVLLLWMLGWCGCGTDRAKDVNVVLIVIDTLRADHLPFYGYQKDTAPFMDRLAQKSVVFDTAYSASCWTSPATASILTSLYPFQHGVTMGFLACRRLLKEDPKASINRIPEAVQTFAEVMKEAGYATFAVTDNHNICELEGFDQGFDRFLNHYYLSAEVVNQDVLKWEEEIRSKDRYFLYLHYMDPHTPLHGRAPWYKKQKNEKADDVAMYDSEINYVDHYIGELYERLGWNENTLLIITADHGEELWDRGQYGHLHSLHNEIIHVPCMIQFPPEDGLVKRVTSNVSTIDLLPTVREYIGMPASELHEGKSMMPLIQDTTPPRDRYIFSHMDIRKVGEDRSTAKSTIHEKMKYYLSPEGVGQLYDLEKDPLEQNNLIDQDSRTAKRFDRIFDQFKSECRKYDKENADWNLDEETMDRLEALGY